MFREGLAFLTVAANADRMADLAVAMARNRLEVFSLELSREKRRIQACVVLSVIGGFVLVLALGFGAAAAVLATPPEDRVLALALAAGGFLLFAVVLLLLARARLKVGPRPFAYTMRELGKHPE